jgi:glycine cleavage system T protein
MKHSRLHDRHFKAGAIFGESAGWEMPVHYGDAAAEHEAVRRAVGIADLSHRGKLKVTGEDRLKWLQSIISNDILPLQPGQGRYSSLLTHKGKMLTYFRVYVQPDHLLVEDVGEIGEATFQAFRKFLLYGTKAKMENWAETWGLLLVSGPKAADTIQAACGTDPRPLASLHCAWVTFAGHPALLTRSEETGEDDFELFIQAEGLIEVWDAMMKAGAAHGIRPFGTQAREALRIEAGLPMAGSDLNEEIVPPEANLEGKAFSLSKGCYPGQEVVARMDTYGSVRRHLVGLILADSIVPPKGAKLFSGDREVGWISSATYSPQLNAVIAFGYPLRDFAKPDTVLTVDVTGTRYGATVRTLPFYTRN